MCITKPTENSLKPGFTKSEVRICVFSQMENIFLVVQQPHSGLSHLIPEVLRSHKVITPHLEGLPGWEKGLSQRPLPGNTQHSYRKDIHAPGGIQTHNPKKLAL